MNARYTNPDNDPRGRWKTGGFSVKTYTANYDYPITTPSGKIVYPPSGSCWQTSKENYEKMLQDNRIYFGKNGDSKPQIKQFLSEVQQGVVTKTFWKYDECGHNQIGKQEIKALFSDDGVELFSTPKPESLIKRIIEISTQPNDIVMDFFLGSGTTAAVAHKMNRQYIGIEQMDYIESVSVERLKKVIEGEQGGISKAINWQGGGEFIYFELAKFNQNFIDKISDAKAKDILNIYDEICEKAFLNYDADSKILKDKKDDFKEFNLAEQKEFLINILNKNMLYVNLDDIEDENYEISQKDKELNKDFYNE